MRCEDAELLLAAHAVGVLEPGDASTLHHHLEECRHCRIEGGLDQYAADLIAASLIPVTPPARLRSALLAQVVREAGARALPAPPERRPPWYRALRRSVCTGRRLAIGGGLSATAAAGLAAWSLAVSHAPQNVTVRVAACGAAAGPAASCVLVYDRSAHQSVLTVAGLATPPVVAGAPLPTYEVWLISGTGSPTPAAILTERPGGTDWSAAIPGDLSGDAAVATTAEPSPDSLTPQGPEVLRVSLPANLG